LIGNSINGHLCKDATYMYYIWNLVPWGKYVPHGILRKKTKIISLN